MVSQHMYHLSVDFCEHWLSSFCVIVLKNKQTSADKNTTSLAAVINVLKSFNYKFIHKRNNGITDQV